MIGHNNTKHFLCPVRSQHSLDRLEMVWWESVPRGFSACTWKLSSRNFPADRRPLLIWRLMEVRTYNDEFFSLFLKLNKILKNSTPGKVACIWHIERVQIDATKCERTQIHFLLTFSLPSLLTLDSSRIAKEIVIVSGFFVEGGRQTLLYSCKWQEWERS